MSQSATQPSPALKSKLSQAVSIFEELASFVDEIASFIPNKTAAAVASDLGAASAVVNTLKVALSL
jgi:hypothetical protein